MVPCVSRTAQVTIATVGVDAVSRRFQRQRSTTARAAEAISAPCQVPESPPSAVVSAMPRPQHLAAPGNCAWEITPHIRLVCPIAPPNARPAPANPPLFPTSPTQSLLYNYQLAPRQCLAHPLIALPFTLCQPQQTLLHSNIASRPSLAQTSQHQRHHRSKTIARLSQPQTRSLR